MRLAVFSDLHGNVLAWEAALKDYEAQGGADVVWILGDLAAFGPYPAECVSHVRAIADAAKAAEAQAAEAAEHETAAPDRRNAFRAVRGNTDRYLTQGIVTAKPAATTEDEIKVLVQDMRSRTMTLTWALERLGLDDYRFLAALPAECDLVVPGYGVVIGYHAVPGSDEAYLKPDTPDEAAADFLLDREGRLAIGGHIHVQMDRTLSTGWRVVNVGSVGMSFDQPGHAQWGLFTFDDGDVTVDLRAVPYDVEAVVRSLKTVTYPAPDLTAAARRLREGKL